MDGLGLLYGYTEKTSSLTLEVLRLITESRWPYYGLHKMTTGKFTNFDPNVTEVSLSVFDQTHGKNGFARNDVPIGRHNIGNDSLCIAISLQEYN